MIQVKIGTNYYEAPSKWSEIKVYKAIELHHISKTEIPKELYKKYELIINSKDLENDIEEWTKELDENEIIKTFPTFYGKIIKFFTGANDDIMDYTTIESRSNIYFNYFEKFVIGILFNGIGYTNLEISSFKHDKKEYFLPSEKRLGDLLIPCNDLTTVQFCESADLISYINKQERGFKFAPYVVAILCLQKDEKYKEDIIVKRAENEFQHLPMDIVWEVFFCLHSFQYTSMKDSQVYSQLKVLKEIPVEEVYPLDGEDSSWTYTLSQTIPFSWN